MLIREVSLSLGPVKLCWEYSGFIFFVGCAIYVCTVRGEVYLIY